MQSLHTLHYTFLFYNCTNCDQLYVKICHVCDLYSSLELASQNAVCRCAHPRAFMLLLEFGPSPMWATVMLQIFKCRPSDSCLLQYDSRTTPSRHLYVMAIA